MTVGELRKALEGMADDLPVAVCDESNWVRPEEARLGFLEPFIQGVLVETQEKEPDAKPFFLIA